MGVSPDPPPPAARGRRFEANREQVEKHQGLSPGSQGQNVALTVLYVPYSLESGVDAAPNSMHFAEAWGCSSTLPKRTRLPWPFRI
jgi:hypothetical protein